MGTARARWERLGKLRLSAQCHRGAVRLAAPASRARSSLMIRFHPAIAVTASALVIAVIGCTTPQGERPPSAKTPIEHVIVVVGENISFDNLYGTYEPAPGQSVANLLSKGIVRPDGPPGPHVALSAQHTAAVRERYLVTPPRTGAFKRLPQPGTTYALNQPKFAPDQRFPTTLPN